MRATAIVVAFIFSAAARSADAQPLDASEHRRKIFFGATGGLGVASIRHRDLDASARPGFVVDLQFGFELARHLSIGGQFTTWGDSGLLVPVHLHTLGARIELTSAGNGPFAAATLGIAFTEGNQPELARAGGAAGIAAGYRWYVLPWASIGPEVAMHAHLYGNGHALLPFGGSSRASTASSSDDHILRWRTRCPRTSPT